MDGNGDLKKIQSFDGVSFEQRLTVLIRKVKFFNIAYIPMAPEMESRNPEDPITMEKRNEYFSGLEKLTLSLKKVLPRRTIFVRYDVPIDFIDMDEKKIFVDASKKGRNFKKSRVDIQPPDTVLLSLEKSEDELLAEMRNKWRYNIRLASKKGVEIEKYRFGDSGFEDAFDQFYKLFQQTSQRDGVSFHAKSYYQDLLSRGNGGCPDNPLVTLYLAKNEEDYLAGIITLFCPREAVYLYGASGNVKRNLMPAYLLQWTAIQDAKKAGCPVYDFYGCPPTDDENHPMHGLYLFKTGFGGNLIHRPGSYDFSLSPLYVLYEAVEKMRAWWFKVAVKKLHGR